MPYKALKNVNSQKSELLGLGKIARKKIVQSLMFICSISFSKPRTTISSRTRLPLQTGYLFLSFALLGSDKFNKIKIILLWSCWPQLFTQSKQYKFKSEFSEKRKVTYGNHVINKNSRDERFVRERTCIFYSKHCHLLKQFPAFIIIQ